MKRFETALYSAALVVLGALLLVEGQRTTTLLAKQAITPKALYALLGNKQVKVQLVDVRPYDDDNFLDAHVPGAIPMPGCDEAKAPEKAKDRVYPYVATVIISAEGDAASFEACRAKFAQARNLEGGMTGWSDATLPEDTGDYSPPKAGAGGGCL